MKHWLMAVRATWPRFFLLINRRLLSCHMWFLYWTRKTKNWKPASAMSSGTQLHMNPLHSYATGGKLFAPRPHAPGPRAVMSPFGTDDHMQADCDLWQFCESFCSRCDGYFTLLWSNVKFHRAEFGLSRQHPVRRHNIKKSILTVEKCQTGMDQREG